MSNHFKDQKNALPGLVKFSCGCIGFEPNPGTERALLVYWCDADYDSEPYGLGLRAVTKKSWTSVDADKAANIFRALSDLLSEGSYARKLKDHLRIFLQDD